MNRRHIIYAGAALLLLLLLGLRWGCRRGDDLPQGDTLEARLAQIDAMRRRKHRGDVERLAELARHDAQSVRSAAVYALSDFQTATATEALRQLLESDGGAKTRAAAADALGRQGAEIPRLIEILSSDQDVLIRAGAARGLVAYSTTARREALPAFLAALRDDDAEIRKWAIRGVTAISKKRFLYEPDKPPQQQTERIAFIQRRMRELKLLD